MLFDLLLLLAAIHLTQAKVTVKVDESVTYQRFDGLGISEAFQRSRLIYGLDGLSQQNTERVLDLLFSNTKGAGLTILRNGIGSSAEGGYDLMATIAPRPPRNGNATSGMARVKYDWDGDDNGQVRLTKDALKRGLGTVYADAWSAPAWMKNNFNDSAGGYLCGVRGVQCSQGDMRRHYADYLVQYLRFYKMEGIKVDVVGFLNQPDYNSPYASMNSTGEQAADFLKVFHPILKQSDVGAKIACCEGGGWTQSRELNEAIKKEGVEDLTDIATTHGYLSRPSTPLDTSRPVWQTDWADLDSGFWTLAWHHNGSAGEGLTWAMHLQHAFAVSNISAFLYSVGAGNTTTNSALILLRKDEVKVSKRLWAFAQYSRFVKPGAIRVDASIATPNETASIPQSFLTTAFRNEDGGLAVQVINNGTMTDCIEIQGLNSTGRILRRYLTNDEYDMTKMNIIMETGGSDCSGDIVGTIPAKSMMSFVLEAFAPR